MLTCAADRTRIYAYVLSLDGSMRRLKLGNLNPVCETYQSSTFDSGIEASIARNGAIAFVAAARIARTRLYLTPAAGAAVRQLTHFNDFVRSLDLGRVGEIASHGPGGFAEYGVLTFPPHMQPHRIYPIVVNIHGGPGMASLQNFAYSTWPRAQLIAARGYIVYEPNYRGSDNIGNRFLLVLAGDTVRGPAADIMSGLAEVKKLPRGRSDAYRRMRLVVRRTDDGAGSSRSTIFGVRRYRVRPSTMKLEEYATSTSNVQNSLLSRHITVRAGWRAHLPRAVADHLCKRRYDADAFLGNDARSGRADSPTVRVLSCRERTSCARRASPCFRRARTAPRRNAKPKHLQRSGSTGSIGT